MAADEHQAFELFLEVYGTLPRAGPGGDAHTVRALRLVPGPAPQAVLDLGCGPGAQTVALASTLPDAMIVAVDLLDAMVDRARDRVAEAGLADRVECVIGDMAAPPVEPGSQDLIWSEGAIYNLGVTEALRAWRPLLRPGGSVAFTEPVWLVEEPPQELHDWWSTEYPAISGAEGVETRIGAAEYRTVESFVLPPSAWWDEYYEPMQERIDALEVRLPGDPVAGDVVTGARAEIDFFRRFSACYSYQFFIVEPVG